ncbi:MAG: class I SAM-dependent methyltransferase [Pseudomonadota bacterium]
MDRKKHWETVYEQKSPGEVSWYQRDPVLSLELIQNAGIARDAAIIDVGGGASVLVDRLLAIGYRNVSVLDLSARALVCAQARLSGTGHYVTWIEADVTTFVPPVSYDLWHDRAVFHFLTDADDRRKYVEVLKRSVKSGGHVIIAAFAIGGPTQCSGLDIVQYDAEKLSNTLGASFRLMEERAELHVTPAKKEQKFAYFRFVRE